jgi:beta-glucanase (GH16 family)
MARGRISIRSVCMHTTVIQNKRPRLPRINTTETLATYNTFGLLWTSKLVEWRFNGRVVERYTNATHIPFQKMQLRLHTRSGYCSDMAVGSTFNATFKSFSYTPVPVGFLHDY